MPPIIYEWASAYIVWTMIPSVEQTPRTMNGPPPNQNAQSRRNVGLRGHKRYPPATDSDSYKALSGGTVFSAVLSMSARYGNTHRDVTNVISRTSPTRYVGTLKRCSPLKIRVWQESLTVRATRYQVSLAASRFTGQSTGLKAMIYTGA